MSITLRQISASNYLPQAMDEVEKIYNNQKALAYQFMEPIQIGMNVEAAKGQQTPWPAVVPSPHVDVTPWLDLHYKSVLKKLLILLGCVITIQYTHASG